jgi:uncharacterized protein YigE (DUF2233 family)
MSFSSRSLTRQNQIANNLKKLEDSLSEIKIQHYIDSLTPFISKYNEFIFNCQSYNQDLEEQKGSFLIDSSKLVNDSRSYQSLIKSDFLQKLNNPHTDSSIFVKIINEYLNLNDSKSNKDSSYKKKIDSVKNCLINLYKKDSSAFQREDSLNIISKLEKTKASHSKLTIQRESLDKIANEIKSLSNLCKSCSEKKENVELDYNNSVYATVDSLINKQNTNIRKLIYKGKRYLCFFVSDNNDTLNVSILNNKTQSPRTIKMVWDELNLKKGNPVFVMNAGMFKEDYSAQGLLVENGKLISNIDKDTSKEKTGNFYMYPNGIFYIDAQEGFHIKTTKDFLIENNSVDKTYTLKNKKLLFATQSGPMMVVKNKIHHAFNPNSKNVNIRNGVGVRNKGSKSDVFFVISEDQVTFFEFASFFKDILHCQNALYLDGFVSRSYMCMGKKQLGKLDNFMGLGPAITISKQKRQ